MLYRIPTGSGVGTYTVNEASCTCPVDQYQRRRRICKHRQAVALYRQVVNAYLANEHPLWNLQGKEAP